MDEEKISFGTAFLIENARTELEGPYKCPFCGGYFTVDIAFISEIGELFDCMYCGERLTV